MTISKKELGTLVKKAREVKANRISSSYSQSALSKDIDRSRGYISDIENGRSYPSYNTLCSIAEACGIPMDFFQSDVEKTIEYKLSKYPEDTVNEVKENLMTDTDAEMNYLSPNDEDSIKLMGYFTEETLENDEVPTTMPTNTRLKLLMTHKCMDIKKLSKLSGVPHEKIVSLRGGFIYNNNNTSVVSDESYHKLARILCTTPEFLKGETNFKWNYACYTNTLCNVSSKEDLIDSILNLGLLKDHIKCDITKLSEQDKEEFVQETLKFIEILSYKFIKYNANNENLKESK